MTRNYFVLVRVISWIDFLRRRAGPLQELTVLAGRLPAYAGGTGHPHTQVVPATRLRRWF